MTQKMTYKAQFEIEIIDIDQYDSNIDYKKMMDMIVRSTLDEQLFGRVTTDIIKSHVEFDMDVVKYE